jgi:hypothetical protein
MSTTKYPDAGTPAPADNTRAIGRHRIERRDLAIREAIVDRVVAEFREMPCLRLTPSQAQRLFGLRADVSARVIGSLVMSGQLRLDEDGRFAAAACANFRSQDDTGWMP